MKKTTKILSILALTSIATISFADGINANADASYAIGYQAGLQISTGFDSQNIKVNKDQTIQGINDALNSKKPRISEWQINKNMERLSNQIIDSKKEADKNNAKNSESFMSIIAKMNNVIKITDGVYYQIVTKGDGAKPNANSTVTISYNGTTPVNAYQDNKDVLNDIKSGKLVGKSFDSNDNATFPLQSLIPCWKEGIPAISKGTTFILYCSADKAYGQNAPASIGPNQALSFKITLKDFK